MMNLQSLLPFKSPLWPRRPSQGRRKPFSWKQFWQYVKFGLIGFGILLALLFVVYAKDLPTPGKIKQLFIPESTQIMDREGNVLFDVNGKVQRFILESDQIPKTVKDATVAVEDKDFYRHHGVDIRGIARAVYTDLFHRKSGLQGGSTITQQFVKNALLSPKKTIARKVKELILSIEIEALYSKEQILTFYLNEIPYGGNAYGIEAASKTYFDKPAKDLTLGEAALLAGLAQAPTYYSPYGQHKADLLTRKNAVLDKMADQGYITKAQAADAKKQELTFVTHREQIGAPHFSLWVRELLVDQYGEQEVLEGGLRVTTTLDPKIQEAATNAMDGAADKIKRNGGSNAALAAVDPKTGQVLAMVGSLDYFDVKNEGNFNVAVASRQPGSSFKPFAYATAFKGKYNPAYPLWDVPTDFGNYAPQNFDGQFHGMLSMRYALDNSLNIPAVKTLGLAGIDNVIDTAKAMGITTLNDRSRYGLSLVLGGGEVRPIDMASAFGVFGNGGVAHPMNPILKITDRSGKVLQESKEDPGQDVLDPNVAYEINHVLSDNGARSLIFGTNSPLHFSNRTVAAKTGTTQSFRDAWTVGYTPSLAAAVWVGNNDNTPMNKNADGVVVAAPIFNKFMNAALKDKPDEPFPRPEGIREVAVDKYSNKLPGPGSEVITDIFAPWQVPTDVDDVHQVVPIDTTTGKKATASCPTNRAVVQDKVFMVVHSEQPKRPNWEDPVVSWAKDHGLYNPPPEETCSAGDSSNSTSISFTTPKDGTQLVGPFQMAIDVGGGFNVQKVEYFIDGISVGSSTTTPFIVNYDADNLAAGSHTIIATATDQNNQPVQGSIAVTTRKSGSVKISGVSVTTNGGNTVVNWTTNVAADSTVQYGPTPDYGQKVNDSTLTTSHALTLSGLTHGALYHFRVVSRSGNGDLGTSNDFIFTAP